MSTDVDSCDTSCPLKKTESLAGTVTAFGREIFDLRLNYLSSYLKQIKLMLLFQQVLLITLVSRTCANVNVFKTIDNNL